MSHPRQPRPPISPWPIGAAILGAFVALALFLGDSSLAVQVMIAVALIVGLLLMRTSRRAQPPGAPASNAIPSSRAETGGRRPSQAATPSPTAFPEDLPAVLTIDEVAAYLRSDVPTITAELQAGRLPGNRLGPDWRIRRRSLEIWLDGVFSRASGGGA
jgi:excisionase family DNA binding protein